MLALTFRLAYDMFKVPPANALGIATSKTLVPVTVANSLTTIVLRVLLLLIMGVVSSLIANKGVFLYTHSRGLTPQPEPKG